MAVERYDPKAVVDLDGLAVIAEPPGIDDRPRCGGIDRRGIGRVHVDAGMKGGPAVERVDACAKRAGDLVSGERRRNRQGFRQALDRRELFGADLVRHCAGILGGWDKGAAFARSRAELRQDARDIDPGRTERPLEPRHILETEIGEAAPAVALSSRATCRRFSGFGDSGRVAWRQELDLR